MAEKKKRKNNRGTSAFFYTMEEKFTALELLKKNEMNISRTAREVGCTNASLLKWKRDYWTEMFKSRELPVVHERVLDSIAEMRNEFLPKWKNLLEMATERFEQLIPEASNIDHLQRATLTFAKLADLYNPDKGEDPPADISPFQFFTQINNKYINNEATRNTISGDSEEPAQG